MVSRRRGIAGLAIAGLVTLLPAARAEVREISLAEAVRMAREDSPDARRAAAEVMFAEAALADVRPLVPENPSLEGSAARRNDGAFGDDWAAGAAVTLYVPGQRGFRLSGARRRVTAARAELEQVRLAIAADAAGAFLEALAARERARLAEASERLAAELLAAAEQRVDAGAAAPLDRDLARMEYTRARLEQLAAVRIAAQASANLARRLGIAPGTELRPSGDLAALRESALPGIDAIRAAAAARRRGDVESAALRVEAARRERTAERLDALPRPTLFGEVAREEGDDLVRLGVSLPLPFPRTNAGGRRAARARLAQARAEFDAATADAGADLEAVLARYSAARAAAEAFDGVVLEALERNESALADAFRGGKIDFAAWILLRRDAIALRAQYFDALADLRHALYELERAVGGTIDVPAARRNGE